MLLLAQAWAEEYAKLQPTLAVEVSGGGSGQGIAALIKGSVDIANCSRNMKAEEKAQVQRNTGQDPVEHVVGYDALAVFVHHENPRNEITLPELADIYRVEPPIRRWSQLGARIAGGRDRIVVVNRQSSSGTYEFFREHVLNRADFQLGSLDMNGSKEVVDLIGSTPGGIGYSGMAFVTHEVKMLRVSAGPGQPYFAPTLQNVLAKKYPISRSLLSYTLSGARASTQKYIAWLKSEPAQQIVADVGYVPLPCSGKASNGICDGTGAN